MIRGVPRGYTFNVVTLLICVHGSDTVYFVFVEQVLLESRSHRLRSACPASKSTSSAPSM